MRICTCGETEGEEERGKCVANVLGDAITEGKALEQAYTQTLVASQPALQAMRLPLVCFLLLFSRSLENINFQ